MVDKADIQDKLRRFFKVQGEATIHASGVVDVQGNVTLKSLWRKLPVQFGVVTGFFLCAGSQLHTLEGAPHSVGDVFDCSSNALTHLTHAPRHVGKHFRCSDNLIQSLQHAPTHVSGYFNCAQNRLTNLLHAPTYVELNFTCHGNPLTSLKGMPEHVGNTIWITWDPQLPLLRTLVAKEVQFMNQNSQSVTVDKILNKYVGQGKPGAIRAAGELIKAGFKENARW
jgi:hypothetical protein